MAIQFDCPFCTSPIRVPDSAGGKRGSCPRCKSKILVPKVNAAAATATETKPAPPKPAKKSLKERFTEAPDFSQLGAPAAENESPAAVPEPPPTPQAASVEPATPEPPPIPRPMKSSPEAPKTYSEALKRRRRSRWSVWLPVIFGLVLIGGVAGFFLISGRVKLEGTLKATPMPGAALPPRTINEAMIPGGSEKKQAVLKYLRDEPLPLLRSDRALMEHEVSANSAGLTIRVNETASMKFFRVAVRKNAALRDYLKENAEKLDKPRVKALDAGLKDFIEASAASIERGGGIPNAMLETLRSRVAINSLVGGAGYNLVASIKGQSYLCMYEDDDGRLYFLLPADTREFTLKGRPLADGKKLFPGRYTVEVGAPVSENVPVKSEDKTESETSPEKTGGKTESDAGKTAE